MGVNDYSKTAASNTDISGTNINEGCAPAGINDAVRELMADIAAMIDGTDQVVKIDMVTLSINGEDITATADEFNKLAGATISTTELNKLDGITGDLVESASGTISGFTLRAPAASDVTLTSIDHAFQIGLDTGPNLAMDSNEIQSRDNGAAAPLVMNREGGNVSFGTSGGTGTLKHNNSDVVTVTTREFGAVGSTCDLEYVGAAAVAQDDEVTTSASQPLRPVSLRYNAFDQAADKGPVVVTGANLPNGQVWKCMNAGGSLSVIGSWVRIS